MEPSTVALARSLLEHGELGVTGAGRGHVCRGRTTDSSKTFGIPGADSALASTARPSIACCALPGAEDLESTFPSQDASEPRPLPPRPPAAANPTSGSTSGYRATVTAPGAAAAYPTTVLPSSRQDVYRTGSGSAQPSPADAQHGVPSAYEHRQRRRDPPLQPPPEQAVHPGHPYQLAAAPGGYRPRPLSHPSIPQSAVPQHHLQHGGPPPSFMPSAGAAGGPRTPGSVGFPITGRFPESQPIVTSPRAQRKAKGHVASACVPCKRAHLRCDNQRPCSRCLTSGKQDNCVDVQHKKRGRPRLRDEREAQPGLIRTPAQQLPPSPSRRPLSAHVPGPSSIPLRYDFSAPHTPSGHGHSMLPRSDQIMPSYVEGGVPQRQAIARQPPQQRQAPAPPAPQAVAFLSLDLEISRTSEHFSEAVGQLSNRRTLEEMVTPTDRERIAALKSQLQEEQRRRDPNYLPPILGRGDEVLQRIGFTAADIGRYQLPHRESLVFVGADGQLREHDVYIGLANEGSFYFIVLMLVLNAHHFPPPVSPHDQAPPHRLYHHHQPQQQLPPRPISQPDPAHYPPAPREVGGERRVDIGGLLDRRPDAPNQPR
ncbi:GAL4 [Geosmithia morbida]|uniref:GAL4 n=1 Tax=Geosmithia morbida TaxID=1094350 RepID=A0A9P4Z4U6_9HYPO|nr:GAL4 [Geosmithia morbida]KAF4126689.1 GAL4 [Geosmithia morbida]